MKLFNPELRPGETIIDSVEEYLAIRNELEILSAKKAALRPEFIRLRDEGKSLTALWDLMWLTEYMGVMQTENTPLYLAKAVEIRYQLS